MWLPTNSLLKLFIEFLIIKVSQFSLYLCGYYFRVCFIVSCRRSGALLTARSPGPWTVPGTQLVLNRHLLTWITKFSEWSCVSGFILNIYSWTLSTLLPYKSQPLLFSQLVLTGPSILLLPLSWPQLCTDTPISCLPITLGKKTV